MRNTQLTISRTLLCAAMALAAVGGCTPPPAKPPEQPGALRRADAALAADDYAGTIAAADEQLAAKGNTMKSRWQAYYLKGRAIEARPKPTPAATEADLKEARLLYESALGQKPAEADDVTIRASLANVAYFQDDFIAAMSNWTAAYDKTRNPDTRAWILYRIGLCQQRLGRFDQADRTFEQVQRNFPNTEQAKRAREHQGVTSFSVQVGTFNKPEVAQKLTKILEGKNLKPATRTDIQGRHVVTLPGYATYDQAKKARDQVAGDYPDAFVFP